MKAWINELMTGEWLRRHLATLGWEDDTHVLEGVVTVRQAVMSNWDSESLPQEKEKMVGPLEKARHDPEAWEGGRMERWQSETHLQGGRCRVVNS